MNQTKFIILKSLDKIYHFQTPDLKNIASLHAPGGSAKGPLHEPTPGVSTSVSQSSFKVHITMEVDGEPVGSFHSRGPKPCIGNVRQLLT